MSKEEKKSKNGSNSGIGWALALGFAAGLIVFSYLRGFLAFAGLHEPVLTWTMQLFWTAVFALLGAMLGTRSMWYRRREPKGISSADDIARLTGLTVWASIPRIERERLSNSEPTASKKAE